MPLYCNVNSLEPLLFIWNKLYRKELPWCIEMIKRNDIKVSLGAHLYIPQSLMSMEQNIHLEANCMAQCNVCFYLIGYQTWNQETESTAMFLRSFKLCPWNNVFDFFVIIHCMVISFNEFSCRSVHGWGKNNIVPLHILPCSTVVECIWKKEDKVFSSGKKIRQKIDFFDGNELL